MWIGFDSQLPAIYPNKTKEKQMIWFVIAIITAIITIGWFIFAPGETTKTERGSYGREDREITLPSMKHWGWIGLPLTVILLFLSTFAIVGTRNVGVETQFSAPTGRTTDAGWTWKAPWHSIHDVDARIQVEEYKGDDCIYVKIADGGTACISLGYRWRINPDNASKAYQDYGSAEDGIIAAVKKAVVSTNIKAAINETLGTYDPLSGADIKPGMTAEEISNIKINVVPDYQQINKDIKDNLDNKITDLGGLVDIESVTVSYVKLPDATEKKINAFNQAVQDTKIALQQIATAGAQADANNALAASLQDPNVLVAKCFNSLAQGEFNPPAGFSCWPGAGGAVVVPAAK